MTIKIVELEDKKTHSPQVEKLNDIKSLQKFDSQSEEAQEQIHLSTFAVYLRCSIIAMGSLFYGYQLSVLNLAQKKLDYVYGLEDNLELYQGLLASSMLFGSIFGCFLAGILMKKIGERKTAILCDIMVICLCSFYVIPEYYVSVTIRALLGVLVGINATIIPIYLSKISPDVLAPKTGSFQGIYLTFGIFLAICLGQGFPVDDEDIEKPEDVYWRIVLMMPILFSIIRLIALSTIYNLDTPQYYLQNQDPSKAKQFLSQIYKQEFVEQQFQALQKEHTKSSQQKEETYASLFSASQKQRTFLGMVLQILLQFTGIIAILFYSSTILEDATGSSESANIISLIIMAIFTLMPLFSGTLVKKFGRRPILLYGNIVIIISLFSVGTTSLISELYEESEDICGYLSIFFILLNLCSFNLTVGTVVWIYNAEILGGKGNCLATSCQLITAFIIGLVFPIGQETLGIYSIFYIFAGVLLLGMPYLYRNLKETKGIASQDIEKLFQQQQQKLVIKSEKMENTKTNQNIVTNDNLPSMGNTQTALVLEKE